MRSSTSPPPAAALAPAAAPPRQRRVLMLARQFPPIGGAGVHRSLGSVRHLLGCGYEPSVITGEAGWNERWSPEDRGLFDAVPADVALHRIGHEQPDGIRYGWRSTRDRWLLRCPAAVRWWVREAVAEGIRRGGDVDLVYASCIPYESAEAAARIARALDVPWVADLEDPWALDEMRVQPTLLHHRVDLHRMRSALSTAAAVVTCAPEAARRIEREVPGPSGRIVTSVPIGFEREPFERPARRRDDGVFRIVHTGSMHTELGLAHRRSERRRRLLGGTSLGVDIHTRSHVYLIAAIERLLAARPELRGRVELQLAGGLTGADRAAIGARDFVRDAGLLGHAETVDMMRSADLLFLPMHDLPAGARAGLVPYKTYEYLAARRPILAAVPDGDVRDLLAPLADAALCRPGDVAGMTLALADLIDRGPVDEVGHRFGTPPLDGLERARCVERIAAVLDAVLDRDAAAAGQA